MFFHQISAEQHYITMVAVVSYFPLPEFIACIASFKRFADLICEWYFWVLTDVSFGEAWLWIWIWVCVCICFCLRLCFCLSFCCCLRLCFCLWVWFWFWFWLCSLLWLRRWLCLRLGLWLWLGLWLCWFWLGFCLRWYGWFGEASGLVTSGFSGFDNFALTRAAVVLGVFGSLSSSVSTAFSNYRYVKYWEVYLLFRRSPSAYFEDLGSKNAFGLRLACSWSIFSLYDPFCRNRNSVNLDKLLSDGLLWYNSNIGVRLVWGYLCRKIPALRLIEVLCS